MSQRDLFVTIEQKFKGVWFTRNELSVYSDNIKNSIGTNLRKLHKRGALDKRYVGNSKKEYEYYFKG